MIKQATTQTSEPLTLDEARNLQVIENNPLTDDEIAMFAMFDRNGWTSEQRIEYIKNQHLASVPELAAE